MIWCLDIPGYNGIDCKGNKQHDSISNLCAQRACFSNDGSFLQFLNTYHVIGQHQHWFRPWASYQIRKIAGCACAGNAGNVFPRRRYQRKTQVSDPGMHHGTCVTHVPWCMSGWLTRGGGENVPGIPGACAPAILRIWQEAHGMAVNAGLSSIKPSGTNFNDILVKMPWLLFKMMHLKAIAC